MENHVALFLALPVQSVQANGFCNLGHKGFFTSLFALPIYVLVSLETQTDHLETGLLESAAE